MTGIGAGGGHPQRRNHHGIIAPVRSLENLPGIGKPMLQRKQVATDVRVLLVDTVTYHLPGVLKPLHRHWLIHLQRIYNFLLFHAILSTVLDYIGLYFPLLYYFLGLTN